MNNKLITTLGILLIVGCSTTAITADDYTLSASMTLRDGSTIKGKLLNDTIKCATIFDDALELSASSIKSIAFSGTNGVAKTTLVNGDTLSTTISTPSFDLDSTLGKLTIAKSKLCNVSIAAQRIAKPNGMTDGEYCIIDIRGGAEAASFPVWYSDTLPDGDEFKTTSIVLKKIPAGTFKMCNRAKVTISKPFFIGVYEITRRQYQLLSKDKSWENRWWKTGDNPTYPVNFITFNMIRGALDGSRWPESNVVDKDSIIDVLRTKTGLDIDLPTEAQWEYACRAGTTSLYNNGGSYESDLKKLGRYRGSGRGLAEVGSYEPNAWGLYDMHGNVFEWCLDWGPWHLQDCTDPVGNPNGESRCLRGGSQDYRADECTSDFRYYGYGYPTNESAFFGFRISCPAK